MSAVDDFRAKFDSEGRLRDQNGSLAVVFATKGGGRFPGQLHFIGSSPNRVGRKSPVRASKPLDFQGFLLLLGVKNPA